jgi:predicted nuclease of predicted toxin-antitoxin system
MKFIVDAQLPMEIARILKNRGFDAIHTDDLPDKEKTTKKIPTLLIHTSLKGFPPG